MDSKYIIALEIASSKIKGAAATVDSSGVLTVLAVEEEKLIDCVRYGWTRNVEEVSNRVNRIIKKLENRLSPRKVKSVYVAIGGQSFCATPREVERRLPEESQITDSLVEQLKSDALNLAFSDNDTVGVETREFMVDRTRVSQPVGMYGREIKARVNLISCRSTVKRNIGRAISERLGFKINDYIVRQTAEADLVLSSDEKRLGCMLVDFGAETTGVSIYKDGHLQYFVTLPLGSRNITIDIAHGMNLLEERAEEGKKAVGNAAIDGAAAHSLSDLIDATQVNNYVAARAGEIIANINEQIRYASLTSSDLPAGIIIVGCGAKLRGFNERLSQVTKLAVRTGQPSQYVRIMDGRIQPSDAVDVIATLLAATRGGAVECMEHPLPPDTSHNNDYNQEPEPEPEPEPTADDFETEEEQPRRGGGLWGRIIKKTREFIDGDDDLLD